MARTPVEIVIERRLPRPRDAAYAWLTDFESEDVARAGAVLQKRRILERGPTRIVYEAEQQVLGRQTGGTTEVTLHPPDRWEARVTQGPRLGSFTHYRLVPDAEGARLTVHYHLVQVDGVKHAIMRLAKPLVKRELERMWDGFSSALTREIPEKPAR